MTHRPGCDQPTPTNTPSRAMPGLTITRCPTCGALRLTRETK